MARFGRPVPLWHLLAPAGVSSPFHGVQALGGENEQDVLSYLQTIKSARLYRDPTRWDRFLWHTAYIREIHHKSASQAIDDENRLLLQAVIKKNGGKTVLPLLPIIDWRGLDPSDGVLIPLFTSTLRDVTFAFNEELDEAATSDLLRPLHESSPLLEEIVLNLDADLSLIQDLDHLSRLHHIGISRISGPEAFQAPLTRPNLTHLSVAEVTGPWVDLGRTISVRDLCEFFVGGSMSALSDLLSIVHFEALKSATIYVIAPPEERLEITDISTVLALFYAAVSTSGLRSLEFMLQGPVDAEPPANYPALRDLVAPILPVTTLRSFTLFSVDTLTTVGDADIAALADAWPALERLFLQRAGCTKGSGVSINGIHHLHGHSPNLTELSFPGLRFPTIGVDPIPEPLSRAPNHSSPHCALRQLYVPSQHVQRIGRPPGISDEAAEALARYLLDLFPSLEGREFTPAQAGGGSGSSTAQRGSLWSFLRFDDRWAKVEGYVHAIRSAKEGL